METYSTTAAYADYMARIKKESMKYVGLDPELVAREMESHVYEAMRDEKYSDLPEPIRLDKVLKDLGTPEKLVRSIAAEMELEDAIIKKNVVTLMRVAFKYLFIGSHFLISGIIYTFSFAFGLLFVAKILFPNKTGLFYSDGNFLGFGVLAAAGGKYQTEILGYWFLPITAVVCVCLFYLGTLLLRKSSSKRKEDG